MIRVAMGVVAGALVYKLYSESTQKKAVADELQRERQADRLASRAAKGRAFEGSIQEGITFRPSAVSGGHVTGVEAIRQGLTALGVGQQQGRMTR
tara:strand:+ start:3319 stop:3603 length:285 start_codon:yes stop_codon:yes gene_type:complete